MEKARYFFDETGTLIGPDNYVLFESGGYAKQAALAEAAEFVTSECDAVRFFWADEMSDSTKGNYSAETLFARSRRSPPPHPTTPPASLPPRVWVEFKDAHITRRLARWVKAVWVEQPTDHRAKCCLSVEVINSEAERAEAERRAIVNRALAKLTAEERAALGHPPTGKP